MKGGQSDGGQDGINRLTARGFMGREGLGEQVEGGKIASAGMGGGVRREWTHFWPGGPRPEEKGDNWDKKSGIAQSKVG